MKFPTALWASLLVVTMAPLSAEPTRVWSHGNPSNDEQDALQVINRLRADPTAALDLYGSQAGAKPVVSSILGSFRDQSTGTTLTGVAAWRIFMARGLDSFRTALNPRITSDTMPPKPPLAFYPFFSEQARTRGPALLAGTLPDVVAVGPYNSASFFNVDSSTLPGVVPRVPMLSASINMSQRAPRTTGPNATGGTASLKPGVDESNRIPFYRKEKLWIANLYAPEITLRELFLKEVSNRDFYVNLFADSFTSNFDFANQGRMRMVGISIGDKRTEAPGVGARQISVMGTDSEAFETSDLPFGGGTLFITGVAYTDSDKNNDYTPGEGAGGVAVKPSTGDWYAVTSSSGGYAIPVAPNSGPVTLTATVDGIVLTKTVTVGSDSVKVDFVQTQQFKPGQTTVAATEGINQIVNLSTRGVVERDAAAMVGGFVIGGTTPGQKTVLIRAVANTLQAFGIGGVLLKPMLTLYNAQGAVVKTATVSDTYNGTATARNVTIRPELATSFAQVGAFALSVPWVMTQGSPSNVLGASLYAQGDAAMVVTLAPGAYTAIISPDPTTANLSEPRVLQPYNTSSSSGVVLLEIYDMTPNSGGRFINLATRGKIESGARAMMVGFSIRGSGHRQLLVRGVGPTLQSFGLAGAIGDSAVSLYDSESNLLVSNDDWGVATWADQAAQVAPRVGAFGIAATSRDGVILTRLAPSNYTVIVSSTTGDPGVALAEVYEH